MLRLSANRLMELPNNLGQIMPSLSEMWVENNRLRALPDSLGYFTTLHLLVAHTNKVRSMISILHGASTTVRCCMGVRFRLRTSLTQCAI
jgi:Leucine-rich repeat (LRR) protein